METSYNLKVKSNRINTKYMEYKFSNRWKIKKDNESVTIISEEVTNANKISLFGFEYS